MIAKISHDHIVELLVGGVSRNAVAHEGVDHVVDFLGGRFWLSAHEDDGGPEAFAFDCSDNEADAETKLYPFI